MATYILVFGDSFALGRWDKKGGWVNRLRNHLDKKTEFNKWYEHKFYELYNLSIGGNRTPKLLRILEGEIKPRYWKEKDYIILFQIGTNDAAVSFPKEKPKVRLNEFRKNIKEIIEVSKKYSRNLVFLGLTPSEENKVTPAPWNKNFSYKNKQIKKYNHTLKEICKSKDVHFVDLFEKMSSRDSGTLLVDGVHPNTKGHQLIFEVVKDYLIKENLIS